MLGVRDWYDCVICLAHRPRHENDCVVQTVEKKEGAVEVELRFHTVIGCIACEKLYAVELNQMIAAC